MKNRIQSILFSDTFVILAGLILVPILSQGLLSLSPESPLYTSISRIAWVHDLWIPTCIWAVLVMSIIGWLTYRMANTGMLERGQRRAFLICQFSNIALVFIGCLIFPAKNGPENIRFVNYIHDFLTAGAWFMYVLWLIAYTVYVRRKDKFLGLLGFGLMGYILISSVYSLIRVIDPNTYVGASAVSEVQIIQKLLLYLVIMYLAQKHINRQTPQRSDLSKAAV